MGWLLQHGESGDGLIALLQRTRPTPTLTPTQTHTHTRPYLHSLTRLSQPWLKSTHTGQIVTYDDPQSMSLKAQFALQAGLRGCNVFSMDGDWTGSAWPLTDAVRSGMGL